MGVSEAVVDYSKLSRKHLIDLINEKEEYSIQEILYSVLREHAKKEGKSISFVLDISGRELFGTIQNTLEE